MQLSQKVGRKEDRHMHRMLINHMMNHIYQHQPLHVACSLVRLLFNRAKAPLRLRQQAQRRLSLGLLKPRLTD